MQPLIFLIHFFTTFTLAANTIRFINHCPYDAWFWIVGSKQTGFHGEDIDRTLIPGHGSTTVHNIVDTIGIWGPRVGGISLGIRGRPYYRKKPAGIIQVEYNFVAETNSIWYDFSAIDCNLYVGPTHPEYCPLLGGGVRLWVPAADQKRCPEANCIGPRCHNTYQDHGSWYGEPSWKCNGGSDLVFEMCTWGPGARSDPLGKDPWDVEVAPKPYVPHALPPIIPVPDRKLPNVVPIPDENTKETYEESQQEQLVPEKEDIQSEHDNPHRSHHWSQNQTKITVCHHSASAILSRQASPYQQRATKNAPATPDC